MRLILGVVLDDAQPVDPEVMFSHGPGDFDSVYDSPGETIQYRRGEERVRQLEGGEIGDLRL